MLSQMRCQESGASQEDPEGHSGTRAAPCVSDAGMSVAREDQTFTSPHAVTSLSVRVNCENKIREQRPVKSAALFDS